MELRKGCVKDDEGNSFNDFMMELREMLKNNHKEFWQLIITNGIGLITD